MTKQDKVKQEWYERKRARLVWCCVCGSTDFDKLIGIDEKDDRWACYVPYKSDWDRFIAYKDKKNVHFFCSFDCVEIRGIIGVDKFPHNFK